MGNPYIPSIANLGIRLAAVAHSEIDTTIWIDSDNQMNK